MTDKAKAILAILARLKRQPEGLEWLTAAESLLALIAR